MKNHFRRLLGISDQNGGVDYVSLSIATITLALIIIWFVSPPTRSLPETTMQFYTRAVKSPICVGDPLEYESRIVMTDDTVVTSFVHTIVDLENGRTLLILPNFIEQSIRLQGETQDWLPFAFALPDLPPGHYSARFAAVIAGHEPAVRVTDFEVVECN